MTGYGEKSGERRIAYFITPHGYGHAARASAVMAAIQQSDSAIRFEIFTQVPRWFFQDSLSGPFGYHPILTDIGLVQKTSLAEDMPETVKRLDAFLPFDAGSIQDLAKQINQLECQLVLCDIAPMGIAVAGEVSIPSVLIENFTWDYIYEAYSQDAPELEQHITYLGELFGTADYHVQTQPVCRPGKVDLTTSPVSRKKRTSRQKVRQQLGIPDQAKMVLITMGGIPWRYGFLERLAEQDDVHFIIPGADPDPSPTNTGRRTWTKRITPLPNHSDFFHPDLVNAADAVIGKAGYSTVAEVYDAGIPFGYVGRPRFRETLTLTAFIEQEMRGLPITEAQFQSGEWLSSLAELLALRRIHRKDSNGADQVANFIFELLYQEQ